MMKIYILISIILLTNFTFVLAQDVDENQCCEKVMETLSALTGSNLYQVYLNISIMNENVDCVDNYELFDENLYSLEKQLKLITDQLSKFNKSKFLKKVDFEYIFQLKEIVFLLQEDVRLFRIYLGKDDDDAYKNFFLQHGKVYKSLDELLVLSDTEDTEE